MAQAVRTLSPKQIQERMQQHRQAVMVLARLAAKKAVQQALHDQGVRLTVFPYAELTRQAREYLDAHPELYQQALERAHTLGYIDPRLTKVTTNAQKQSEPISMTSASQISGTK